MKSLAHPEWPYTGTPQEWRGFAERPDPLRSLIDAGLVKTDVWLRSVGEELPKPKFEWKTDILDNG